MIYKKSIKIFLGVCVVLITVFSMLLTFKTLFSKAHSDTETTKISQTTSSVSESTSNTTTKATTIPAASTATTTVATALSITKAEITSTTSVTSTKLQTTQLKVSDDFSKLDNCVFIGNSRVIALKNYGLVKNAYAVVGLTVDTIFTKSVAGSTIPVIDELSGKNFEKVFIMLGDNECGWGNKDIFIERYSRVIDAVKERIPDADVYLQSVLPVSQNASENSPFGVTNDAINNLNIKIEKLAADYNINYINPASALKNSNGVLPDDAASDGIHLNKKYCKIWLTYILDNVFSKEAE